MFTTENEIIRSSWRQIYRLSNLYVVVRDDEQGSEYQGILPNSETLLTLKVKMDVV